MVLFFNRTVFGAVVFSALCLSDARAQTTCPVSTGACAFSITGPQQFTLGNVSGSNRYLRITTNADLWCTRASGITPAVNGAGSYKIPAGSDEEFPVSGSPYVPIVPTYCTPASGVATGSVEIN